LRVKFQRGEKRAFVWGHAVQDGVLRVQFIAEPAPRIGITHPVVSRRVDVDVRDLVNDPGMVDVPMPVEAGRHLAVSIGSFRCADDSPHLNLTPDAGWPLQGLVGEDQDRQGCALQLLL
jgi:hypothetical protein